MRRHPVDTLYRQRPKNLFVRGSLLIMLLLIIVAWFVGDFVNGETFAPRRAENIARFLRELLPYPLQHSAFDFGVAFNWFANLMQERGWHALTTTLAISVAAIVLAGIFASALALPAARNITTARPFTNNPVASVTDLFWLTIVYTTRLVLIFLRAIPEYVWAFLLLALLGPTAWPAVLALALHNAGILGKLSAEVIEDVPAGPMQSLTGIGASRRHIAIAAILPLTLPRLMLFFFYRWETCVREATVLGMLGIVSLGFWIQDARARNFYDEMFFFILLGAMIVMAGDVLSTLARGYIRRIS